MTIPLYYQSFCLQSFVVFKSYTCFYRRLIYNIFILDPELGVQAPSPGMIHETCFDFFINNGCFNLVRNISIFNIKACLNTNNEEFNGSILYCNYADMDEYFAVNFYI